MMDSYMKKVKMLQIFNTLAFILTVIVNGLANILPINGQTTGAVSDSYPNLFAPAGLTFSIWGVIYLGLGFFVLYQLGLVSKKSERHINIVTRIGWSFVIASIANCVWIFAWHYNKMLLSVIIMLILLIALVNIHEEIHNIKGKSLAERLGVEAVFSVYLGWISVATIANITTYLVSINWGGFGISEQLWTIIIILVATIIALGFVFYKQDVPYALVTEWAFLGILIKHVTYFAGKYKGIITIVTFSMIVIFASILAIPKTREMQRY